MVRESVLPAAAESVWARAGSAEGINDELRPWLTMSIPRGLDGLDISSVEAPQHLGRSWIRLFGLVVIDFDDITVAEVGPGFRFLERSRMFSAPLWQHERTVTALDDARCQVRDELTFTPRRGFGLVLPHVVGLLFAHRHARLRRHWSDTRTH